MGSTPSRRMRDNKSTQCVMHTLRTRFWPLYYVPVWAPRPHAACWTTSLTQSVTHALSRALMAMVLLVVWAPRPHAACWTTSQTQYVTYIYIEIHTLSRTHLWPLDTFLYGLHALTPPAGKQSNAKDTTSAVPQALIAIVLLNCMGSTPSRRMLDSKSKP